jgi:hypothetical protein
LLQQAIIPKVLKYEDENIWLTQKMLSVLDDVEVQTINEHIAKIFADDELNKEPTIRKFRIVQAEGWAGNNFQEAMAGVSCTSDFDLLGCMLRAAKYRLNLTWAC